MESHAQGMKGIGLRFARIQPRYGQLVNRTFVLEVGFCILVVVNPALCPVGASCYALLSSAKLCTEFLITCHDRIPAIPPRIAAEVGDAQLLVEMHIFAVAYVVLELDLVVGKHRDIQQPVACVLVDENERIYAIYQRRNGDREPNNPLI
jgi:hypothetical protein